MLIVTDTKTTKKLEILNHIVVYCYVCDQRFSGLCRCDALAQPLRFAIIQPKKPIEAEGFIHSFSL